MKGKGHQGLYDVVLAWEELLRELGDVEEEGHRSQQVHHQDLWGKLLQDQTGDHFQRPLRSVNPDRTFGRGTRTDVDRRIGAFLPHWTQELT